MVVLANCERGLTAKARHPNGMMDMMRGFTPVSISYEEGPSCPASVGPVVLFSTSTALATA